MAADAQVCGETAVIEAPAVQSLLSNTDDNKFSDVGSEESECNSEKNVNSESVDNGGKDCSDVKSDYKMQDIVDMLKKLKLNPLAKEFVPSYFNRDQMLLNNFVQNFVPVIKTVGEGGDAFQNNGKVLFLLF